MQTSTTEPINGQQNRSKKARAITDDETVTARVIEKEHMGGDVQRLVLLVKDNNSFPFSAGQYLRFLLPNGECRSVSIANAPDKHGRLECHIKLIPGGMLSEYARRELLVGAKVCVQGPFGRLKMDASARRPALLLAGGTGVAPAKGLLEHAFRHGRPGPLFLYWSVNTYRELYLDTLFNEWARTHSHFHYRPILPEGSPHADGNAKARAIHEYVRRRHRDLPDCDVYLSGSPDMVRATRTALLNDPRTSVDPTRIFFDAELIR